MRHDPRQRHHDRVPRNGRERHRRRGQGAREGLRQRVHGLGKNNLSYLS